MATQHKLKRTVLMGLLVALGVVGAYIRLGPWSISLDAAAGFTAALLLGPGPGALVSFLGHLAAAGATGFPLTPPFHLAVALAMAGVGLAGATVARRFGLVAGAVALVLANGFGAPAFLSLLPNPMGRTLFAALWVPLTAAAGANALIALVIATVLLQTKVNR